MERLHAAVRQDLLTVRAFGVDFTPLSPPDATGGERREPSAEFRVPSGEAGASEPEIRNLSRGAAAGPLSENPGTDDKRRALAELLQRHDATCPHCTAATYHTRTVFGEGNPDAALMFVGEAPGEEEDRTGRPFVGRAGRKLDEIIQAMTLRREDVYIANVLKSRPPENRTPLAHEAEACGRFLAEQVGIIRPRVIVTLGGPATKLLLRTDVGITKLRGVWAEYADEAAGVAVPVMPTFHPAYLLRNYTPQTRQQVWSDMLQVMDRLGIERPR